MGYVESREIVMVVDVQYTNNDMGGRKDPSGWQSGVSGANSGS